MVLDKQARGRGLMVVDWLNGDKYALEYLHDLKYNTILLYSCTQGSNEFMVYCQVDWSGRDLVRDCTTSFAD